MKTYLTFVLGIVLGIVIGFVIFTTTPIGLRYKYMTVGDFDRMGLNTTSFLVKYDTWSGKASVLSRSIIAKRIEEGSRTSHLDWWVPLPSSSRGLD